MRKRLSLIQVSRALVPILVVLFHASGLMYDKFNYNYLGIAEVPKSGGVYYFFILSGFMAYYIYHRNIGNHNKIKKFLFSRFIRIYPIYWIITFSVIPVYFLVPSFGIGYETDIDVIISSILLLPHQESPPILVVAWSLVYTVIFYLWFAFLSLFKRKYFLRIFTLWLLLCILISFVVNLDSIILNELFNRYNLSFGSGLIGAYIILNKQIKLSYSYLLLIIGFLGFPLTWLNSLYLFIQIDPELSITISSVILILALGFIDINKEVKVGPFLNYLGNASFSIYLTHFLSLSLFVKISDAMNAYINIGGFLLTSFIIIMSFVLGCAFYSIIEKPLLIILKKLVSKKNNKDKIAFIVRE